MGTGSEKGVKSFCENWAFLRKQCKSIKKIQISIFERSLLAAGGEYIGKARLRAPRPVRSEMQQSGEEAGAPSGEGSSRGRGREGVPQTLGRQLVLMNE